MFLTKHQELSTRNRVNIVQFVGYTRGFEAYNLGNGQGFSVKQVIDTCRKVTGVDIKYSIIDRRPGDPAQLVGSAQNARTSLEWEPRINTLETIIETAWRWMAANP